MTRLFDHFSTAIVVYEPSQLSAHQMSQLSAYQILAIAPGASKNDIEKAFKKAALQYHPDKPGGNREVYELIERAYKELSGNSNEEDTIADITSLTPLFLTILDVLDEPDLDGSCKARFIKEMASRYAGALKTLGVHGQKEEINKLRKLLDDFNFWCDIHFVSDRLPPKGWSGYLYKRNSSGRFVSITYRQSSQDPEEVVEIKDKEKFEQAVSKKIISVTTKIQLSAQDREEIIMSNGGHNALLKDSTGYIIQFVSEDELPPEGWSGYLYKRNSSGRFVSITYRQSSQDPEEVVEIKDKEKFEQAVSKKIISMTTKIRLSEQDRKKIITSNGDHATVDLREFAEKICGNKQFFIKALDVFLDLYEFSPISFSSSFFGFSAVKNKRGSEIFVEALKFHVWLESFSQQLGNSVVASKLVEQLKDPDVIAALRRLVALGKMTTLQLEKIFKKLEASNDPDCSVILGSVYGISLLNKEMAKTGDSETLLHAYVDKHIAFIQGMKKFREETLKIDRQRLESNIPGTHKKVEDAFLEHFAADDSSRFIAELLFPLYVDGRFTFDGLERIYQEYFKINANDDDAVKKHKLARTEIFWMLYNGEYRAKVVYCKTTNIFADIKEFLDKPELTISEKPPVVVHQAEPESIYQRKDLSVADKFMCYVTYDKYGKEGSDSRAARVQTLNYFPALASLQKLKLAGIRDDFKQGKEKAEMMKKNKKIDPSNKLSGWVDLIHAADKRLFDGICDTVIPFLENVRSKATKMAIKLKEEQQELALKLKQNSPQWVALQKQIESQGDRAIVKKLKEERQELELKLEQSSFSWVALQEQIGLQTDRSIGASNAIWRLEAGIPRWCEEARHGIHGIHSLRLRCVNFKDYCKPVGKRGFNDEGNHILHNIIDVLNTAMNEGKFRKHRNLWRDVGRGFFGTLAMCTGVPEIVWFAEGVLKWGLGRERKYWHGFCGAFFWTESKTKTVACKDGLREECAMAARAA